MLWTRQTGLFLFGILPVTVIAWNVVLSMGSLQAWHQFKTDPRLAAMLIAGGVCLTVVCSSEALGTGRRMRTVGGRPRAFRSVIRALSAAVSVALLVHHDAVATRALATPDSQKWPRVLIAPMISLTALTGVGHTRPPTRRLVPLHAQASRSPS